MIGKKRVCERVHAKAWLVKRNIYYSLMKLKARKLAVI